MSNKVVSFAREKFFPDDRSEIVYLKSWDYQKTIKDQQYEIWCTINNIIQFPNKKDL